MRGGISKMAKQELLATIRDRYRESSKKDKSRILDEFIAVTGHHRKHGIRLLRQSGDAGEKQSMVKCRRIYDEAVREAVILVWEATDRICGKRLKAALPHLVESMERHGHLDLDPEVRERLLAASAATLDRLLKPVRTTVSGQPQAAAEPVARPQLPVQTFADWHRPPPGFLEIDLVAYCGDNMGGSFIFSLVATDVCTGWPDHNDLSGSPAGQTAVPGGWQDWKPSADSCPSPSAALTRTTTACSSTQPSPSTAPSVASSSPAPGPTARTTRRGLSRRTGRSSAASSAMIVTQAQ